jgi:hypothetical protein
VSREPRRKQHLREVSERHLMVDAMRRVALQYPSITVATSAIPSSWFWSRLFVPVYRRVPWELRQRTIQLTGMSASGWTPPDRRPGEPWRAPDAGRSAQ